MAKIGIIGAGTWGTALGILLESNGHKVTIWSALESEIDMLKNTRKHKSLPDVELPDSIEISADLESSVKENDVLVFAVASSYTRQTAHRMREFIKDGQIIVNVAKGIEDGTLYTLSEVIEDELKMADVAVLSGPSHAEEVGRRIPTSCVIGAKSKATAEYLQNIFMNNVFRIYTSPDMLGIEIGAALKNVIALAAGIADGLCYGDNTKAALITRGITEIARLGMEMGGKLQTFSGLSGIGDLIVTCASMHSRNRRAGILIGQGYSMEEAMKEVNMVVEGVYSAKAALDLAAKYHVEMPIIEQVNLVLFNNKSANEAVKDLMLRDKTIESSELPWEN
ncbi:MAG: NAD(P)H-dependent glycerol-3-phosphate dehydrogenase [Clostridiales bacterium]|nr:NAD(P)H-dependent glycerol-3-phosphate dehydrogenase [Clostridiales bacterium]